jgi:hypothetical protein
MKTALQRFAAFVIIIHVLAGILAIWNRLAEFGGIAQGIYALALVAAFVALVMGFKR